MGKGLEARWTLNDQDEDKEVDLQSSEEKEMILLISMQNLIV